MIPEAARGRLVNAAPGFSSRWAEIVADNGAQPDEAFLSHECARWLSEYLADELAAGRTGELEWVLAEINTQLEYATEDHATDLRIGLLEGLMRDAKTRDEAVARLAQLSLGSRVRAAWQLALDWAHPRVSAREG